MTFSAEQLQTIKNSTEIYRNEVNRINDLINTPQSEDRLDKLYLLRTIATIEHGKRIGLFDESNSDEHLEAIGREVSNTSRKKMTKSCLMISLFWMMISITAFSPVRKREKHPHKSVGINPLADTSLFNRFT